MKKNPLLESLKENLSGAPFKTVFMATLGYYVAATLIGIMALVILGLIFLITALLIA